MPTRICQYSGCLEEIKETGITITLRTPTFDGESRAVYCCCYHALLSLAKLAVDRKEVDASFIKNDDGSTIQGLWIGCLPNRWRIT